MNGVRTHMSLPFHTSRQAPSSSSCCLRSILRSGPAFLTWWPRSRTVHWSRRCACRCVWGGVGRSPLDLANLAAGMQGWGRGGGAAKDRRVRRSAQLPLLSLLGTAGHTLKTPALIRVLGLPCLQMHRHEQAALADGSVQQSTTIGGDAKVAGNNGTVPGIAAAAVTASSSAKKTDSGGVTSALMGSGGTSGGRGGGGGVEAMCTVALGSGLVWMGVLVAAFTWRLWVGGGG